MRKSDLEIGSWPDEIGSGIADGSRHVFRVAMANDICGPSVVATASLPLNADGVF